MGCDIHLHAEVKKRSKWTYLKPTLECSWCKNNDRDGCYSCKGIRIATSWYDNRNYDLFAMLADVRNGLGFAGCDTGDGFRPIHQPKGIPDDCCSKIQNDCKRWGIDGHSHSFLTVKELSLYPIYSLSTKHTGIIDIDVYKEWQEDKQIHEGIQPNGWCGGISGPNIKIVEQKDLRKTPDATHVRASWDVMYSSCAPYFFNTTLPTLQKIASQYGQENVRIIFWFDN